MAILAGLSALVFRPRAEPATALFAGGCFWSMQKAFDGVPGVVRSTAGSPGSHDLTGPTYEQVSTGRTGYAESVQVDTTRREISYDGLLQVYWHHIDPLTANQAFCDRGPQYRSIIFYGDADQKRLAEASKTALDRSGRFKHAGGDRDRAGHGVPAGRSVPPGVLQEVPRPATSGTGLAAGGTQRLAELWGE